MEKIARLSNTRIFREWERSQRSIKDPWRDEKMEWTESENVEKQRKTKIIRYPAQRVWIEPRCSFLLSLFRLIVIIIIITITAHRQKNFSFVDIPNIHKESLHFRQLFQTQKNAQEKQKRFNPWYTATKSTFYWVSKRQIADVFPSIRDWSPWLFFQSHMG